MDIIDALKQEESKLRRHLSAVQGAIAELNGGGRGIAVSPVYKSSSNGASAKRTLSAAGRARISRAAKARWAKIKTEKAKKEK